MSKSSQIVVRVEPRFYAKLKKAAKRWKVSMAFAARAMLEGAIEKWAGKP